MKQITIAVLAVVSVLSACADSPNPRPFSPTAPSAALGTASSYIVVLERNANPTAVAASVGVTPRWVYRNVLNGFSAELPPQAVAALERNPLVSYIEPDGEVRISDTQLNPVWGLDRIDSRDLPLDQSYTPPNAGSGVTAYIVDTGIRLTHAEYVGRATWGGNFSGDGVDADCHGHGTHVAGTVGGTTYGVAKGVALVAIKALDCGGSGSYEGLIAALDWIAVNGARPAVVNMSLGGGYNQAMNDAVDALTAAGVLSAAAAGNSNSDACQFSPAAASTAVTVGATTPDDWRAGFSSHGVCLDLFAPGLGVQSSYFCSDTCTAVLSGTSMATPHVAGAVALLLAATPTASPADVTASLISSATDGKVIDPQPGSPNKLLFIGGAAPPPPPPPPPADNATFIKSCSGFTCTFTAVEDGSWTFGDGGVATGIQVQHTFAPRKHYQVTHTVGAAVFAVTVNCKPKNRCQ